MADHNGHFRRRVVWAMIVLNFAMFVGLVVAIHETADATHFERSLCRAEAHAHQIANDRNVALRGLLRKVGETRYALPSYPPIDCTTGKEAVSP